MGRNRQGICAAAALVIGACGQQLVTSDPPDGSTVQAEAGAAEASARPDGAQLADARAPCGQLDGGARLAFVTSKTFTGSHPVGAGSLDQLCTQTALAAGLPGVYQAWVQANGGVAPVVSAQLKTAGFARPDGKVIFAGAFDGGQPLAAPLDVTELCTVLADDAGAWTGIADLATNCNQWTKLEANGDYGDPAALDASWQTAGRSLCNAERHFYCFQVD